MIFPHPTTPHHSTVIKLSDGRESRGWRRSQITCRRKVWSSINHLILSATQAFLLELHAFSSPFIERKLQYDNLRFVFYCLCFVFVLLSCFLNNFSLWCCFPIISFRFAVSCRFISALFYQLCCCFLNIAPDILLFSIYFSRCCCLLTISHDVAGLCII